MLTAEEQEEARKEARELMQRLEAIRALGPGEMTDRIGEEAKGIVKRLGEIDKICATPLTQDLSPTDMYGRPLTQNRGAGHGLPGKTYRELFGEPRSDSGFKDSGEFLRAVASGRYDDRLVQARSFGETVPAEGGFSVPEPLAENWLDDSLPNEIVRPRATVWPMTSATRKVPAWDDLDRSSGETHGGLALTWLAEKATATRKTGQLRQIELKAKKAAIYVQVSSELVEDGLKFEFQLEDALRKSLGYGLDDAFINGSGAGQPQGIFNSPALITVSKESGQAADTIVYENLVKMYARMYDAGRPKAIWICNSSAIPQLLQLVIPIGTAGTAYPVLRTSGNDFTIFTRPVYFVEHMAALGDLGDIAFVDFSQYTIGIRREISLDKANAPGWTEDLQDYRVIVRIDGQGSWDKPLTPAHGETQSPFVTLEERT
ncbi:MAG: hypothetical protein B1H11_04655 [Desulfobacteraceae bacterium 4484_190.1]|nr:MAG: hypothetical protein B1H11_04655 [Desulfobacteraceae bacterium 4484_190.1]